MLCSVLTICSLLAGVPHVQDGDTIYVGRQSIRLYGIDAEELSEPNGYRAKYALVSIVANQQVSCKPTGQESHHRIVARCYLRDGREINRLMVEQGHVLDCKYYSHGEYRSAEPSDARARLIQKPYC